MDIRPFHPNDTNAVVALWHEAGLIRHWNDPYKDIERKLTVQPELFLVGIENGGVIATAMGGYDGHRGTVYYLAVAPHLQGKGHGRALLNALEDKLIEMGCPKLNLLVRTGNSDNQGFYHRNGYEPQDVHCLGKRLIAD